MFRFVRCWTHTLAVWLWLVVLVGGGCWLAGWLAGWVVGWLVAWLAGWLAGWAGWLACCLAGWAGWLAGWIGWLAGWLGLAGWLRCLAGWLGGQLEGQRGGEVGGGEEHAERAKRAELWRSYY